MTPMGLPEERRDGDDDGYAHSKKEKQQFIPEKGHLKRSRRN